MNPEEICEFYVYDSDKGTCGFHLDGVEGFCRRGDRFRCPVYDMTFNGKISVSEANDWMKCRRLYQYKYMDGIEVQDKMLPKPMKIGRLIHEGMERIYQGKPIDDLNYFKYFNEEDIKEVGIIRVMLEKAATLPLNREKCMTELRFEMKLPVDTPQINGVFDVYYADHFTEIKATTNPDYYLNKHFIASQLATYFMFSPKLEYCLMQIIRIPQLKSAGQFKDEQGEKFVERVREDVNRRPAYYFVGLSDTGWGKKFWRSEFDLDEIMERYRHIMFERRLAIKRKCFYKEQTGCLQPSPCMYLQVCESGGVSDLIYKRKEVKCNDKG